MTLVEELRAAAAQLRETATPVIAAGDAENWEWTDFFTPHVAEWVTLARPNIAEPLAAWLDQTAEDYDMHVQPYLVGDGTRSALFCNRCSGWLDGGCHCWDNALAVARVVLHANPYQAETKENP